MSNTETMLQTGPSRATLDESERHSVLSDERRRLVLIVMDDGRATASLADLAGEVAARESSEAVDGDLVERVRISLHHKHLPILDDVGVLDYDAETNQVTR